MTAPVTAGVMASRVTRLAQALDEIGVTPYSIETPEQRVHDLIVHVHAGDMDAVVARLGWDPIEASSAPDRWNANVHADGVWDGMNVHVYAGAVQYLAARGMRITVTTEGAA